METEQDQETVDQEEVRDRVEILPQNQHQNHVD
jgi:hypothetical protein